MEEKKPEEYDGEKCFTPVFELKPSTPENVIVIFIPFSYLAGNDRDQLATFQLDKTVKIGGKIPYEVSRLIYTIHHIFITPSSNSKEPENRSKPDTAVVEKSLYFQTTIKVPTKVPGETESKVVYAPKVSLNVQAVYDKKNEFLGWRFVYCIMDAEYNFDTQLEKFFFELRQQRHKKIQRDPKLPTSRTDWVRHILSPYLDEVFYAQDNGDYSAVAIPLDDENNPASAKKVLTMKQSSKDMGFKEGEIHKDLDAVYNLDGLPKATEDQTIHLHTFYRATDKFVDTFEFFFNFHWKKIVEFSRKLTRYARIELGKLDVPDENIVESMRAIVKEKYSPTWVRSREARECLLNVLANDMSSPGSTITYQWFQDQPPIWFKTQTYMMSDQMTIFGNHIARDLLQIDMLMDVTKLQESTLRGAVINLGATEKNTNDMRLHPLDGGPAGAGKSFKNTVLMELSIPKTYETFSTQTAKANTVSKNRNGMTLYTDELPKDFFDPENTIGKELMTTGETNTESINCTEGQRLATYTKTQSHASINGNTNAPFSSLPPPFRDRFLCTYTFDFDREGRDAILDSSAFAPKTQTIIDKQEYVYSWRVRYVIAMFCWRALSIGLLKEMDISIACAYFQLVEKKLKPKGIRFSPRTKTKILLFIKFVVVYNAIMTTFYTVPRSTPLDVMDVLDCAPYMFCSREIFYYSITSLSDEFLNPGIPYVMMAVAKMAHERTTALGDPIPFMPIDKNTNNENYYWIPATWSKTGVYGNVIEAIFTYIKRTNDTVRLSQDQVLDALKDLTGACVTVNGRRQSVLELKPDGFYTGMGFSVEFIKTLFEITGPTKKFPSVKFTIVERENIIHAALKETFDQYTDVKDFVLGKTYTDTDPLQPHLYKSIRPPATGLENKTLNIKNELFIPEGYSEIIRNTIGEKILERATEVRYNIDTRVQKRVCKKLGVNVPPRLEPEWVYPFKYPEKYHDAVMPKLPENGTPAQPAQ